MPHKWEKQPGLHSPFRAFTLIELMVVIAIIALLISILVPSLSAAREHAKEVTCASDLSAFGKGFHNYAFMNNDYFCSGGFDPEVSNGRDGPVDEVGWVADLVKFGFAFPAKQVCRGNVAKYNQKLAPGAAGTDSYTVMEAEELVKNGFNTNYTQSWYMARTEWDPVRAKKSKSPLNLKRVDTSMGPLRHGAMLSVVPAKVPLLGDGRSDNNDQEEVFGERSVKTMTDGPYGGPYGTQSYADFGPAHGLRSWIGGDKSHNKFRANILFADAHVSVIQDTNRDGEFALNTLVNPADQTDMEENEVFDGVLTMGRRSNDRMRKK